MLREALEAENFAVFEASDKSSVFDCLDEHEIHLITLDLKLDHEDGLVLALEIRAKRNVPIVMITGRGEAIDRVVGLEHGADDYIVKPFHPREAILRIRNVLQRYGVEVGGRHVAEAGRKARYGFDDRVLDATRRELRTVEGETIGLTALEFRLLEMFVKHPGRVFSRDEISRLLIGRNWSPLDRSIDGHIARLRRKIEPPGDEPTVIKSVRNVGYVFASGVSEA